MTLFRIQPSAHVERWLIAWLVVGFVLLAGAYSVVNPLFEAPDEVWHYEYVRWLAEGRGLPQPADVGSAPWKQEGSQPPLYYLLAALATGWVPTDNASAVIRYNPHVAVGEADAFDNKNMMRHGPAQAWPWQGVTLAAHLARFVSVSLGAVAVAATYMLARTVFPHSRASAALAGLLVAANPQFLFISAAVSNDNLVTACCALGIWLLVRLLAQPTPPSLLQLVGVGALVGAAALSKVSGLALASLAAGALSWLAWRERSWLRFWRHGLVTAGVALSIAGWWYLRNWQLYGDPLGLSAMFAVLPGRPEPLTLAEAATLAPGVWRSYWAVFGWYNIVADPWVYSGVSGLALLGLGGLVVGLWRNRKLQGHVQVSQLILLSAWVLTIAALVVRWAQISYPQGRLLFPAVSALATLLAAGLCQWSPKGREGWVAATVAAILLPVAVMAPWRWIGPAYAAPASLAALPTTVDEIAAHFGESIALRGVHWAPDSVQPGQTLTLELYWQAEQPVAADYSVFVHLVDEHEIVQAQRDSYPAGGALPTGDWRPGEIAPDRHKVTLPAALPAPGQLRIDVGLYDHQTGMRLQTANGGDKVTLGYVAVTPGDADAALPRINFGDQIALIGYTFDRWQVRAGNELTVTLHWEALATPAHDYVVFVHLLLPPDAVWAQRDTMPQGGAAPTSGWVRGQTLTDQVVLSVPANAPAGLYGVEIGLYHPETGERLKVGLSDAGVRLGQVRVVEN